MDLRDVLGAMRRHWWLVLAAIIASTGIAGVLMPMAVPQWATTVTFFITTP